MTHSISSGLSHSNGSCVLGRIHSDVSSNIPKKVYHIVTDNFVNLLHISQGPRNSGAEGARAPPLFCSNNVSNKRSERNVKKSKCD